MAKKTADDLRADMAKRQHSTPGDIERKQNIDEAARAALRRLKSGQTYEDWRAVGQQLMVITEETINDLGLDVWDGENTKLTHEFAKRFAAWEAGVSNAKPISKQERWALRQLMTDPKYHTFYTTELIGPEQRKTNHPNKIIEKYNRKYPDPNKPKKVKKPTSVLSPALQERDARIQELTEELQSAREELTAKQPTAETKVSPVEADDIAVLRNAYAKLFAKGMAKIKSKAARNRAMETEIAFFRKAFIETSWSEEASTKTTTKPKAKAGETGKTTGNKTEAALTVAPSGVIDPDTGRMSVPERLEPKKPRRDKGKAKTAPTANA